MLICDEEESYLTLTEQQPHTKSGGSACSKKQHVRLRLSSSYLSQHLHKHAVKTQKFGTLYVFSSSIPPQSFLSGIFMKE